MIHVDWGPVEFVVSSYRVMLIAAGIAAAVTFLVLVRRRGLMDRRIVVAAISFAVGALAGARILGTINTDATLATLLAARAGHFSIWGGIAGGVAAVLIVAALSNRSARAGETSVFSIGEFLDVAAPSVGIGIAVARVGCWMAGCCFGLPTSLPWGVRYPAGSPAHIAYAGSTGSLFDSFAGPPPVHPVPLYEIAAALSGAAIALWAWHRFVKPGRWIPGGSAAVFVAWYSGWRFLIEFVRHESPGSPLSGSAWQIVFAVIAATAVAWLLQDGAGRRRGGGTADV